MLVLSTSHMSAATARDWIAICPWACFEKADHGWFMHVCEDACITEAADIPLEIRSALHVARSLRCAWIMWNRDGPIIDELPHYDW